MGETVDNYVSRHTTRSIYIGRIGEGELQIMAECTYQHYHNDRTVQELNS